MTAYFHNIGQPDRPATFQSLWDSLRRTGVVSAGYGNLPDGRGYKVLNRYQPGDTIFAYANGHGVVGYGIAQGPATYRLVEHARHGHNHRHEVGVRWRSTASDVHDALAPSSVRQITSHLPRRTSEKLSIGADRLQSALDGRWARAALTRSHVLSAFGQLDREGYPPDRESRLWDVLDPESGRRFPPKLILNRAAELAGLNRPGSNFRGGGWPTNDILSDLGFDVVPKEGAELRAEQSYGRMDLAALRQRAEREANLHPRRLPALSTAIPRSPAISAYAKRAAAGRCDLCREPAPFRTRAGPFLECHHIHRLADGGPDCVENVVALCPNCHRKMHLAPGKGDKSALLRRVKEREK